MVFQNRFILIALIGCLSISSNVFAMKKNEKNEDGIAIDKNSKHSIKVVRQRKGGLTEAEQIFESGAFYATEKQQNTNCPKLYLSVLALGLSWLAYNGLQYAANNELFYEVVS